MKKTLINFFLHPNEKKKARIKKISFKIKGNSEKICEKFFANKIAWARQLAAPPPRRGPGAGGRGSGAASRCRRGSGAVGPPPLAKPAAAPLPSVRSAVAPRGARRRCSRSPPSRRSPWLGGGEAPVPG